MATSKRRLPPRARDLARIHMLAKDLGLDRDTYEDVLWTVARVHSSKDLDEHGRNRVIEHLQAHAARRKGQQRYPGSPNNLNAKDRPELKKIEALLADAQKPWSYAESIAKRMYHRQRLEWCDNAELASIIAALERAAIKRLHQDWRLVGGEQWPREAAWIAALGFGFDVFRRDVTRSTQALSQALRWKRGVITASCAWGPGITAASCPCCGCVMRMMGPGLSDRV